MAMVLAVSPPGRSKLSSRTLCLAIHERATGAEKSVIAALSRVMARPPPPFAPLCLEADGLTIARSADIRPFAEGIFRHYPELDAD